MGSKEKRKNSAKLVNEVYKVEQPSHSIYHPSQYKPEILENENIRTRDNQDMSTTQTKLLEMNQFRFPNFNRSNKKINNNNHNSSNPLNSQARTINSFEQQNNNSLGGF